MSDLLSKLPEGPFFAIIQLLEVDALCKLSRTCRRLNSRCNEDRIWMPLYNSVSNRTEDNSSTNESYKQRYFKISYNKPIWIPKRAKSPHFEEFLGAVAEVRIAIFGNNGVGKTRFIQRYVHGMWETDYKYEPRTEDTYRKPMELMGKTIIMEIADTAEHFASLVMPQCHICLLIFDIADRESFSKISSFWIPLSQEHNKPAILIGNKVDRNDRVILTYEATELAKKHQIPYFECSGKTDVNVSKAFEEAAWEGINSGNAVKQKGKEKKCIVM